MFSCSSLMRSVAVTLPKQTVFNFFLSNKEFQNVSNIFTCDCMKHSEIEQAGLKAALSLYGAKQDEIMATLRNRILTEKVLNSTTFVNPERLPLAKDSLEYHSYRCYYSYYNYLLSNFEMDATRKDDKT